MTLVMCIPGMYMLIVGQESVFEILENKSISGTQTCIISSS